MLLFFPAHIQINLRRNMDKSCFNPKESPKLFKLAKLIRKKETGIYFPKENKEFFKIGGRNGTYMKLNL